MCRWGATAKRGVIKKGFQCLDRLFRAKPGTVETLVLTQERMAEGKMTTGRDHTIVKA